jgi:alkanesulfonate monooxygenase SsuD/methylene tetrahydromethanopterin reductase-like flavin-dependent oxidoreductase (luciferase family)
LHEIVNVAVGVPNVGEFADPVLLVELAVAAEAAGWDGFFVWDHLLYDDGLGAVEPWSVIAAAASVTHRIRIGVLMTAVPRRQPALLAQQIATIDLLSGGRCVFGAGLGSRSDEYARFGHDPSLVERGRRLDEALTVIESLWSPGPVRHAGEFFTANDVELLPKPMQEPHPPIWIGGRWPHHVPFRRAARFDGVMPTHADHGHDSFMSPGELREIVDYVRRYRTSERPFDVVMEGMSDGPDELARLSSAYREAGLTWWIEKLGWWRGTPDHAIARVNTGPPGGR